MRAPGSIFRCLPAEHATAPQRWRASVTGLYLPREVFFGGLGFAGAFVPVCAGDIGRFFPATSGSFRLISSRRDTSEGSIGERSQTRHAVTPVVGGYNSMRMAVRQGRALRPAASSRYRKRLLTDPDDRLGDPLFGEPTANFGKELSSRPGRGGRL